MPKGIYLHKKGRIFTPEIRKKISLSNIGKKRSLEARKKMSLAKIGYTPWNKGIKGAQIAWNKGIKASKESREKMRQSHLKNPNRYWLGKKRPEVAELGKSNKGKMAKEKHWNWQGGINPINDTIRKSTEYKLWREAVFERDNHTCTWCGQRGRKLNADHIKPFSQYPELRFAIDNGITLCIKCHRQFHKVYGKSNNNIEQINKFLCRL